MFRGVKLSIFVLVTLRMFNRVDLPMGSNPDSAQYDWYKLVRRDATTVLTTFGISIVSPSDSRRVFVP